MSGEISDTQKEKIGDRIKSMIEVNATGFGFDGTQSEKMIRTVGQAIVKSALDFLMVAEDIIAYRIEKVDRVKSSFMLKQYKCSTVVEVDVVISPARSALEISNSKPKAFMLSLVFGME